MYTEDEAHKKWCPFARTLQYGQDGGDEYVTAPHNRATNVYEYVDVYTAERPGCACIASDCMAWRIAEYALHDAESGTEKYPQTGYCGLAGKGLVK